MGREFLIPEIKPMGTWEILRTTVRLYREHSQTLLGVVQVTQVPLCLLLVAVSYLRGETIFTNRESDDPGAVYYAWFFVFPAAVSLGAGAFALVIAHLHAGRRIGVIDAYRGIRGRWLSLLPVGLAVLFVAELCCIFLPLYLGGVFSLLVPVVAVEDRSLREAWARSSELAKGSEGQCAWVCCLIFMLYILAMALGTGAGYALMMAFTHSAGSDAALSPLQAALITFATQTFFMITLPVINGMTAVLYISLRAREAGFNRESLARELGLSSEAPTPRQAEVSERSG